MSSAVPNSRVCPSCETPMQSFYAGKVELDRCGRCGGFFFDPGELEAILRRSLTPRRIPGETRRKCAACRIPMARARTPEGVLVETCTQCRGLFLDAGELTDLGGREPELPGGRPRKDPWDTEEETIRSAPSQFPERGELGQPTFELAQLRADEAEAARRRERDLQRARANAAMRHFNNFACIKCGRRFAFSDGNAVEGGLACPTCVPRPRDSLAAVKPLSNLMDFVSGLLPHGRPQYGR